MRVYTQDDFKLTKQDIDNIANDKDNCIEKVDFDKWIAFEQRMLIDPTTSRNRLYHEDIIIALKHLQHIYEGKEYVSLRLHYEIEESVSVAHYNAMDMEYRNERGKAYWEDVMAAYDIFYILRDTQGYISFHTHNVQRLKFK